MGTKPGRPHNRKGRSKGAEPFLMLPLSMLHSPAYRALTPVEARILTAVAVLYKGRNNGQLAFAARQGEAWGVGRTQTAAALRRLKECGFLVVTCPGSFDFKRHATTYALTWRSRDDTGNSPATLAYRDFKPSPPGGTDSPPSRTAGRNWPERSAA